MNQPFRWRFLGQVTLVVIMVGAFIGAIWWTLQLSGDPQASSALYSRFEGPIALFGLGVAILAISTLLPAGSPPSWRTLARIVLGVAMAVAVAAGLAFYWSRYSDLDVAFGDPVENLTTQSAQRLQVTVDGHPPFRGSLEFTPNIVRTGQLGDCVVPATLALTLLADDVPRTSRVARHSDRVSLEVPAGTRRIGVEMRYINKDGAECRVRVSLADGRLVR